MPLSLRQPSMAAPQAYEQPTINKGWEVFLVHVLRFC